MLMKNQTECMNYAFRFLSLNYRILGEEFFRSNNGK